MFGEVKLKRGAWHWNVQTFVLGEVLFKHNFCPYFWLTIFCIFAYPWVVVGKGVRLLSRFLWFGVNRVINFLDDLYSSFDNAVCQPLYDKAVKKLTDDQVLAAFEYSHSQDLFDKFRYEQYEKSYAEWDKKVNDPGIDGETRRVLLAFKPVYERFHHETSLSMRRRFCRWQNLNQDDWRERLKAMMVEQAKIREAARQSRLEKELAKRRRVVKRNDDLSLYKGRAANANA